MAATLYPLLVPPRPRHIVGLDYLTHLHVSNGFDSVLIVVDHPTRMAHFLPYRARNNGVTCHFVFTKILHITWIAPSVG
jgi:hypothetical protein